MWSKELQSLYAVPSRHTKTINLCAFWTQRGRWKCETEKCAIKHGQKLRDLGEAMAFVLAYPHSCSIVSSVKPKNDIGLRLFDTA